MKITYTQGRQNKIHVSVDGEYMFTVDSEYWYTSPWSHRGEITDDEEQEEFYKDVGSRYAFISGLRLLSYGDNTRKALRRKLVTKGHKPEFADAALDKLEKYGYINDMRFAEHKAEVLISTKHMGKNAVRQQLMAAGVDRSVADEVLDRMEFDNIDAICTLLKTKYARYLGDEKGLKKTVAGLQRLGYGWSDIKSALSRNNIESEEMADD